GCAAHEHIRVPYEAGHRHVRAEPELAHQRLQARALIPFAENQQSCGALLADLRESLDQGRKVLHRREPACTEHDRRLAGLEPWMIQRLVALPQQICADDRIRDYRNAAARNTERSCEIVRDAL